MLNNFNEEAKILALDNTLISVARFIKKEENIIHLAIGTENVPNFHQEVYVILTNEVYGLFTYRCITQDIVISKSQSSKKRYYFAQFYVNENVSVVQRRRDIKVKVKLYIIISMKDIYGKELSETEKVEHKVLVKDISASGMFFVSKTQFSPGQKFDFIFDQTNMPFLIQAEIVREQKDGEYIGYGCKFLDLSPSRESIVRQYVYKMQILLQKNREIEEVEAE